MPETFNMNITDFHFNIYFVRSNYNFLIFKSLINILFSKLEILFIIKFL